MATTIVAELRALALCLCASAVGLVPAAARADPAPSSEASAELSGSEAVPAPERPFLFMTDPSLPAPGHVLFSGGLGTATRGGETRLLGQGPLVPTAGAEVGLLPRLSLYAQGDLALASQLASPVGAEVGAHVLLTDPADRAFRLALQAGLGRDLSSATLAAADLTFAWERGPLELAASLAASRDFQAGADPVDLSAAAGGSVRLPAGFRVGAEAVAEDLEESAAPMAEGGVTAFAGPTVGWSLGQRFEIVGGPAVGLTSRLLLGRAAASLAF